MLPFAAAAIYYSDVLSDLAVRWWEDPSYSHGFFVPIFSLYLLWEDRRDLLQSAGEGSLAGLLLVLSAAIVKLFSHLFLSPYLAGISLMILVSGVVMCCWGWRAFRRAAVPVGFLIFMLPLPQPAYELISLPLQRVAAIVAAGGLQALSIPALREGNVIHFAGRSLEVAEACSGMRLLLGFVAMGVAVSFLSRRPPWQRVLLVGSTVPIAVLANAARVTVTGILYHGVSEQLAQGFFHAFSGWLMFLVALAVLAAECRLLARVFPTPQGGTS